MAMLVCTEVIGADRADPQDAAEQRPAQARRAQPRQVPGPTGMYQASAAVPAR